MISLEKVAPGKYLELLVENLDGVLQPVSRDLKASGYLKFDSILLNDLRTLLSESQCFRQFEWFQ